MEENIDELGIVPYNFEPLAADHPEFYQLGSDNEENDDNVVINNDRIGNINWCTCHNCVVMTTVEESLCCREMPRVVTKTPDLECVTQWRRFTLNCLDLDVLVPAYDGYVDHTQDHNENNIHERYRYVAYRQFIRIIFKRLGRRRRTPISSCVVANIRDTWPSEEYSGFRYPRFNDL